MINFIETIQKGKAGEQIFKEDFLEFLKINYVDVTGCQRFQAIDSDYLSKVGLFEIKTNYKDDKHIFIEEYTNINKRLGPISLGWWYKTRADLLVFISKATRTMVLIPYGEDIKNHYEAIKDNYDLRWNRITEHNGNKWQSAFRKVSLDDLCGYYSFYKKMSEVAHVRY